jgi:hypothetical protein
LRIANLERLHIEVTIADNTNDFTARFMAE